jgi:NTE family protein
MKNGTQMNATVKGESGGQKPINLALQGGGAHGAFTWGVLDRLLEEPRINIEAISGTSAGAMNGVVVADGLMRGGPEAARKSLHNFWRTVSEAARLSPLQPSPIDLWMGNFNLDTSPGFLAFDLLGRAVSPYQLNPGNVNPLRDLIAEVVDFDRVRACNQVRLFISATRVGNGRVRIFTNDELTPDAVMASACLPFLFQAVEIDGEAYWDGGYMGNPALHPFSYRCASRDIVLVQINPLCCQETPKTAREILNRVNEITFNSSLMAELRAIDFVARLLDEGSLDPERYRKMLIHLIDAQDALRPFNASSKLNANWTFLTTLFDIGRDAADRWLADHFHALGDRSSVDVESLYR